MNGHNIKGFESLISCRLEEHPYWPGRGLYLFMIHLWRIYGCTRISRYKAIIYGNLEGTLKASVYILNGARCEIAISLLPVEPPDMRRGVGLQLYTSQGWDDVHPDKPLVALEGLRA